MGISSRFQMDRPFLIAPYEKAKICRSQECTQEGVRAGAKAAAIACVSSAVPTNFSWLLSEQFLGRRQTSTTLLSLLLYLLVCDNSRKILRHISSLVQSCIVYTYLGTNANLHPRSSR
ncbi:PREDICTED: uncharacterized protein LOC109185133 isoform X2 [Ipomoea nil]|uniref:uncharacterized protein LOC109185133 isoform X1 n=1 Tax=Ipomoea nil TaxID=35883 RepID=UPI0009011DCD|nr:PREDICTED: uncharacterized protein LOC109185133 isoform X1 [Ipomoea nil]XP_019190652.1 PREDICTED: uncharacterized protein LOC109185133 isoform X2 [Ipomoea nil]